jgi:hypothetical protein
MSITKTTKIIKKKSLSLIPREAGSRSTAVACSEAGIETAACSETEDETSACSGAVIVDGRRRWHNGVQGDRRVRALGGFKKLLSATRKSVGPKFLRHET